MVYVVWCGTIQAGQRLANTFVAIRKSVRSVIEAVAYDFFEDQALCIVCVLMVWYFQICDAEQR